MIGGALSNINNLLAGFPFCLKQQGGQLITGIVGVVVIISILDLRNRFAINTIVHQFKQKTHVESDDETGNAG